VENSDQDDGKVEHGRGLSLWLKTLASCVPGNISEFVYARDGPNEVINIDNGTNGSENGPASLHDLVHGLFLKVEVEWLNGHLLLHIVDGLVHLIAFDVDDGGDL